MGVEVQAHLRVGDRATDRVDVLTAAVPAGLAAGANLAAPDGNVLIVTNGALAGLLPSLLHARTTVLTLQNGLGNEELIASLAGAQVEVRVGGVVR